MPVFALDDPLIFPHPILREPDGLLAVGGDLSSERLLLAYRWGIFPWYHEDQPLLWWWIAPRLMMKPEEIHVSHSLKSVIRQNSYEVSINQDFSGVMEHCRSISRKGQLGTWIMPEMIDAYHRLHALGYAHSIEVKENGQLVGGLYGILLGKIFSGESMFAERSNASKVAFVYLAKFLASRGIEWIDCQQDTPHMRSMGGYLVEEDVYLEMLRDNQKYILEKR